MEFEQDDFFYYLQIAQNLAHGHGSTFNGIVATNGYHPLWLWILTALSWFTTRPESILGFLAVTIFIATMSTYFLARGLMHASGIECLIASIFACYASVYSMQIFFYCMEVTLAIPLILAVILAAQRTERWQRGFGASAMLGLLFSAMILSRLDTMLLAAMFFAALICSKDLRKHMRGPQIGGLLCGLIPVAVYLLSNHVLFHTWIPISGMAKQVKFDHRPTSAAWRSLYSDRPIHTLNILLAPLALVLFPAVSRRLNSAQRVLYPAVLIFPLLYISILCCLSDWQLWMWYLYPCRPALCIALLVYLLCGPIERLLKPAVVQIFLMLCVIGLAFHMEWPTQQPDIMEAARDLQKFARLHPGIYAMGDRAGMVGYLLSEPVIQTEGLVMDRSFLDLIRRQTPLNEVLSAYHVRYYVGSDYATSPEKFYDGCFHAIEPSNAGPDSAHMRANFCQQPVAVFTHNTTRTLIFDLNQPSTMAH